jgi:hypothetical protein
MNLFRMNPFRMSPFRMSPFRTNLFMMNPFMMNPFRRPMTEIWHSGTYLETIIEGHLHRWSSFVVFPESHGGPV